MDGRLLRKIRRRDPGGPPAGLTCDNVFLAAIGDLGWHGMAVFALWVAGRNFMDWFASFFALRRSSDPDTLLEILEIRWLRRRRWWRRRRRPKPLDPPDGQDDTG